MYMNIDPRYENPVSAIGRMALRKTRTLRSGMLGSRAFAPWSARSGAGVRCLR
jgi:hypothetical protein